MVHGNDSSNFFFFFFALSASLINFVLDLDKCSANSYSCDVNAVCSNTPGSYTCACKAGYSGDGGTCSGIYIYFYFLFIFAIRFQPYRLV